MRDWRGLIAFVLALGLTVALVSGVLTAELTPGKVTEQEVNFLSTLGGAIVGAVATYLGVTASTPTTTHKGDSRMQTEAETPERDEPVDPERAPDPEPETPEPETPEPETPEPETPDERPDEEREVTEEEADAGDITQGMGPGEESD